MPEKLPGTLILLSMRSCCCNSCCCLWNACCTESGSPEVGRWKECESSEFMEELNELEKERAGFPEAEWMLILPSLGKLSRYADVDEDSDRMEELMFMLLMKFECFAIVLASSSKSFLSFHTLSSRL